MGRVKDLRQEVGELGEERWLQKYATLIASRRTDPWTNTVRGVAGELQRRRDEAHRIGEADRSAIKVGHSDNANDIARRANWISLLAVAIALLAALKAWGVI